MASWFELTFDTNYGAVAPQERPVIVVEEGEARAVFAQPPHLSVDVEEPELLHSVDEPSSELADLSQRVASETNAPIFDVRVAETVPDVLPDDGPAAQVVEDEPDSIKVSERRYRFSASEPVMRYAAGQELVSIRAEQSAVIADIPEPQYALHVHERADRVVVSESEIDFDVENE